MKIGDELPSAPNISPKKADVIGQLNLAFAADPSLPRPAYDGLLTQLHVSPDQGTIAEKIMADPFVINSQCPKTLGKIDECIDVIKDPNRKTQLLKNTFSDLQSLQLGQAISRLGLDCFVESPSLRTEVNPDNPKRNPYYFPNSYFTLVLKRDSSIWQRDSFFPIVFASGLPIDKDTFLIKQIDRIYCGSNLSPPAKDNGEKHVLKIAVKDQLVIGFDREKLMLKSAESFARSLGFKKIAVLPSTEAPSSRIEIVREKRPSRGSVKSVPSPESIYDQMPLRHGYTKQNISGRKLLVKNL